MSVKITYFVHGTTEDNKKNISSGWSDVELSPLGIQQSIDLKNQANLKQFDAFFCSDLKRAVQATKLMFENITPIKIDARLREMNYGDYNGKPSSIVEPIAEKSITDQMPNGESYEDVKNRIADFLEDLKKKYDGKHIAIVAHKASQLALDVLLKKMTWDEAIKKDWRKTKSWQPGWNYETKDNNYS